MHTTAEFALTIEDLGRLQRMSGRRLMANRKVRAIRTGVRMVLRLLLVACLLIAFRSAYLHPDDAAALYLMCTLLAMYALLAQMQALIVARFARPHMAAENGAFLRRHVIQFTETSLAVISATSRFEQQWSNVIGQRADDVNYYLFVDRCTGLVVPRHAVAPFVAEFERYIASIPTD